MGQNLTGNLKKVVDSHNALCYIYNVTGSC